MRDGGDCRATTPRMTSSLDADLRDLMALASPRERDYVRGVRILLVVGAQLLLVGCGGKGQARKACEHMAEACGVEVSGSDLRECVDGLDELRKPLGEKTVDDLVSCTRDANTCPEIIGCMAGAGARIGDDVTRGFERMFGERSRTSHDPWERHSTGGDHAGVEPTLPAECLRANVVCAPDEPFARDGCRDLVGNLRADAENLRELTECYGRAKNCFAFKGCSTDMRFKLM